LFIETSAADGSNVEEAFLRVAAEVRAHPCLCSTAVDPPSTPSIPPPHESAPRLGGMLCRYIAPCASVGWIRSKGRPRSQRSCPGESAFPLQRRRRSSSSSSHDAAAARQFARVPAGHHSGQPVAIVPACLLVNAPQQSDCSDKRHPATALLHSAGLS
jgi:hypothetical protein